MSRHNFLSELRVSFHMFFTASMHEVQFSFVLLEKKHFSFPRENIFAIRRTKIWKGFPFFLTQNFVENFWMRHDGKKKSRFISVGFHLMAFSTPPPPPPPFPQSKM